MNVRTFRTLLVGTMIMFAAEAAAAERPFTLWNRSDAPIVELGVGRSKSGGHTPITLEGGSIQPGKGYNLGFPDTVPCSLDFELSFDDGVIANVQLDTCKNEGAFPPY